jgi:hypothetical protein
LKQHFIYQASMATSKFILSPNASALKMIVSPNNNINFGSNFKVHVLSSNNNGSASSCSSRGVSCYLLLYCSIVFFEMFFLFLF